MNPHTAQRLTELRKRQGLTQEELAERLGVSRQAVSKWERGEASPDTDNLVMLARLYGISLDELLEMTPTAPCGGPAAGGNVQDGASRASEETHPEDSGAGAPANIGEMPAEKETERVSPAGGFKEKGRANRLRLTEILVSVPFPFAVTAAFLLWGFLGGGWAVSWTLFLLIPVYYSLIECFRGKKICAFCYPVAVAFVYLLFGMRYGFWHPHWVIFLTIPLFYGIFDPIDRYLRGGRGDADEQEEPGDPSDED